MVLPLIGVSRQPRTVSPSSVAIFSRMPSQSIRSWRSTGRKTIPTPYSPGAGRRKPKRGAFAIEKSVRNLNQDAGAVACLRIAAASAAMRQIDQNLDALEDDVVRFPPVDIGDKADAAAIVLMLRVIETLRGRQAQKWISFAHIGNYSEYQTPAML